MERINRKEAIAAGLKRYFTGRVCHAGHLSERSVLDRGCLSCSYLKGKKWNEANRDKCIKHSNNYRQKNPTYGAECIKRYRASRPDWQKESDKKRWKKDKKRLSLKRKIHQKENPEMWASYSRNRRAKIFAAGGFHTPEQIFSLGGRQNWFCVYCKKNIRNSYTVDHIIALANGGSNDIKNIQLLCGTCNSRKNKKDPIVFAREIGMLP